MQVHRRHVLSHAWHPTYGMDKELVLLRIAFPAYDVLISSICTCSQRWMHVIDCLSHQSLLGLTSNDCWISFSLWLASLQSSERWYPTCTLPVRAVNLLSLLTWERWLWFGCRRTLEIPECVWCLCLCIHVNMHKLAGRSLFSLWVYSRLVYVFAC